MKQIFQFRVLLIVFLLAISTAACTDQTEDIQPTSTLSMDASSNSMTTNEITFTAVAMISWCHGEDIRFTGVIENKVKKSMSASGNTHFIRQFTVKGMTGTGLTTGTIYDVAGGAEMFSIKNPVYNPDGSLNLAASISESDIVIHRGTLVFVSRTDGSRVIARHLITKVPGAGLKENTWDCGGN